MVVSPARLPSVVSSGTEHIDQSSRTNVFCGKTEPTGLNQLVPMKLYCDINLWNRPFDDQSQPRIALETQAFLSILHMAKAGEIEFINSSVLEFENSRNPFSIRRRWIENGLRTAVHTQQLSSAIVARATELERIRLKPLDALHLACAEEIAVDYFLTCDDRLGRHYDGPLQVLNPLEFIVKMEESEL